MGAGGGGKGVEKKKLLICFEDTTTKVADSGRKERNPAPTRAKSRDRGP